MNEDRDEDGVAGGVVPEFVQLTLQQGDRASRLQRSTRGEGEGVAALKPTRTADEQGLTEELD